MVEKEYSNHFEGATPQELVHLTNIYSVYGVDGSSHYLESAKLLRGLKFPTRTVLAALYHGLPRLMTKEMGEKKPGIKAKAEVVWKTLPKKVRTIIEQYHEMPRISGRNEIAPEYMAEMLQRTSENTESLLWIRAVDRYDRLRDDSIKPEDRKDAAIAVLRFYGPILKHANHYEFAGMLEDEAFRTLYPELHARLENIIHDKVGLSKEKATRLLMPIAEKIPGTEIQIRTKSVISTFKKMFPNANIFNIKPENYSNNRLKKNLQTEIRDLVAARLIVPPSPENSEKNFNSYEAVRYLKEMFPGNKSANLFFRADKDYISNPKSNGYQSFHAHIYPKNVGEKYILPTKEGEKIKKNKDPDILPILEVQIRDTLMDAIASYGAAAHEVYKNKEYRLDRVRPNPEISQTLRMIGNYLKSAKTAEVPNVNILREFIAKKKKLVGPGSLIAFLGGPHTMPHTATVFDLIVKSNPYEAENIEKVNRISPTGQKIAVPLNALLRHAHTYEAWFGRNSRQLAYFKQYATTSNTKQWLSNKQKMLDELKKKK